jgi:hypothetical protein
VSTLVYPKEVVIKFVEDIEILFKRFFEIIMHLNGVLQKLCENSKHLCVD